MPRYAIYYAPERSTKLWQFGTSVLGGDPETGEMVPQVVPDGFQPEDWQSFTAAPRRYGFHATLKAPFALAPGKTEADLFAACRAFADRQAPFSPPPLAPVLSGDYVTLQETKPDARLSALADACVKELDTFRAPLSEDDRARRRPDGLSARQRQHLEGFGYPYVFEDFTFHMSLAGPLPESRRTEALAALTAAYEKAVKDETFSVRSLSIFVEPGLGQPFRLALRAPLGAKAS
jgi:putative phosphonate metabolism protein